MKKYIFVLFVLISAITFAQVKVSGKVVDSTGEPVPFADVFFKDSTLGTVSDENGKFYLESDKTYSILVVNFWVSTEKKLL